MSMNGESWYAVHTQVNAEQRAARNLIRQGFEIYLPRYLKRRSHARKIEQVVAPLFPRYLFVRVDRETPRWRSIQSTYGVSQLVCSGADPAPVGRDILEMLRAREDKNGFIVVESKPLFSIGEKVRVLTGAFADNFGLFDGIGDRDRIAILLDLLGRKVRVSIETDMVASA